MERIGVIGGSGLYQLEGIAHRQEIEVNTPFGSASGKFILAELEGREIVFLPRHGKFHQIPPSAINYRANMYGMKKLGVGWVISISACGSLKEELRPLDFVVPTQFLDRTNHGRENTFFDEGIVAHLSFAHPVCEELAEVVYAQAKEIHREVHYGGTYVNIEGPQFSTLAESNLYRSWGMDIIGMTNMVEARLAREAEICYATLAAITDYDCWRQTTDEVTVDMVIENLQKNVANARAILKKALLKIDPQRTCGCKDALKYAVVTNASGISQEVKDRLDIFIGKYIK
ncbi:MAG: S-methyl-5'-thioadenosine phosphorylase [Candidatus Omnitrophica bacterium]|nr:S-methyl-5'-thioadenosine phosphorylase [Candidatus Omnitrophota bacterium]